MMRPTIAKHTPKEIEELMASDDELPDSYDEKPGIPAYLNDNRFAKVKPVEYDCLHQKPKENNLQTTHQQSSVSKASIVKLPTNVPSSSQDKSKALVLKHTVRTLNNKKIISKGVLTKRDLFLIKSVEEYASDATLLWFIDFLNYKAMKPHQRSCLVAEVMNDHSTATIETCMDFKMRYYFKLVVN